jgi:hypothetical protein
MFGSQRSAASLLVEQEGLDIAKLDAEDWFSKLEKK